MQARRFVVHRATFKFFMLTGMLIAEVEVLLLARRLGSLMCTAMSINIGIGQKISQVKNVKME